MINYTNLSINARVALCLIYAERLIPYIENLITYEQKEKYIHGKQQIYDLLDMAWSYLENKNSVNWSELYDLSNESLAFDNNMKYGGYGYFDYVLELNCKDDQTAVSISNVMIYCIYYSIYHIAKQQNEKYLPQDMEWFELEESEAEMFMQIDTTINQFFESSELQSINELNEMLYKLFPYEADNLYGNNIEKENIYGILGK